MTTDGYSDVALGESGDWVRHLALAWRAVADPDGDHVIPAGPSGDDGYGRRNRIAWWSPLLHVVVYGLGWPRPDLGLARWRAAGRPATDERLVLVDRWWGDAVAEMIDWALVSRSMRNLCEWVSESTGTTTRFDRPETFGITVPAGHRWGPDSDPMHLASHTVIPVHASTASVEFVVGRQPTSSRTGRAVLFVDGYAGWYAELHRHGGTLPVLAGRRSWHVDVVCRPLGWLGSYRRSRVSGRWFAGQHRWHELGIP